MPHPWSELQAGAAGAVGQGRNAAVVLVAAAIKNNGDHAGGLRPLGDQLADLARLGRLVALDGAQVRLQGGRGRQSLADGIVDQLDGDVPAGPVDHQPGPGGRADDLLAQPEVPAGACRGTRLRNVGSHGHLPVFPTLRRTTSPAYRTPLPLYGSGLRNLRMLAATSP